MMLLDAESVLHITDPNELGPATYLHDKALGLLRDQGFSESQIIAIIDSRPSI
jgi:hypothetical protein